MSNNIFVEFIEKYRNDPVSFVREILGSEPDPWQKELMEAYLVERACFVKSGHGVGKSTCASWIMLHHMVCGSYPQKTVCTAPTNSQLQDALFAEFKTQLGMLPVALKNLFEVFSDRVVLKSDPSGSFLSVRNSRKENPESLQGVHSSGKVLLVVDEASSIPQEVWDSAGGSLSGNATLICLGNPTRSEGYFYDAFMKHRGKYWTKTVSCEDSPRVSKEYCEEMADRYGKDSSTYQIRVLGEFPSTSEDTIISNELVESAVMRDVQPTKGPVIVGLDIARFGSDRSALCKRVGNTVIEPIKSWAKLDTMALTGAVYNEYQKDRENNLDWEFIYADVVGIGAGTCDRLSELGLPVIGINTGESASLSGQYKNLRCELWHKAKDWFEKRHCRIPRDERLMFELCSPRYTYESSGKIRMETKSEMKKRLGHKGSPDFGDAFVLTFSGTNATSQGLSQSWSKPIKRNLQVI